MPSGPSVTAAVTVRGTPEEAFRLFTDEIGLWWRTGTPYWNDPGRGVSVRIEPEVGGRFVEVHDLETGEGFQVGTVTTWEPGRRLAFTWTQVGWPDGASTDVEVTFASAPEGTQVRLEHRGFDRVPGGVAFIDGYDAGWSEILGWLADHTAPTTHERPHRA